MKKAIFTAVIASLVLTAGCGQSDSSAKKNKDKAESVTEKVTDAKTTSEDVLSEYGLTDDDEDEYDDESYDDDDEDSYDDEENDAEYQFDTGYVSAERTMEIEDKKRSIAPDADGFIIEDGIMYDYVGKEHDVVIPDSVTEIAERACWSNDDIETLYIPSSVKIIRQCAFWSCASLKSVRAEEGLEAIAGSTFWSCAALEDAFLPQSLNKMGDSVFWAIDGLTIHAPNGSYAKKYASEAGIKCDNDY